MKKLLLAITLMLGSISFGQIEVEQINFGGEKFFKAFETAKCEILLKRKRLKVYSGDNTMQVYRIKERQDYVYYYGEDLVPMIYLKVKVAYNVCGIYIQKNYPYIVFEYTDGTLIINSGKGITYQNF